MRKVGDVLLYSPSDLVTFVESDFVSWMDRLYLEFPDRVVPDAPEGIVVTIRAQGNQHEVDYLSSLVAQGVAVTDLSGNKNNLEPTLLAMQRGDPVIYQAYLSCGDFAGYADFLVRVPGNSRLGQWHYEVHDTKIAREPKPYHLIQLCCYAEMLEAIQGRRPKQVAVVLGNTNKEICQFRTDDFYFHYLKIKESFLSLQETFDAAAPPSIRCKGDFGRWSSHVERLLEEQDHLSRVANISVLQIARLQRDGITTMLALSETRTNRVTKMLPTTFERLRTQARLQISSKGKQRPDFELLPADENDPRRGLALLPARNDGDIFFDLEGYPLIQNGLEYLFGVSYLDSAEFQYQDWWAHDYDAEKVAFAGFINWAHKRWKQYQGMHIYHYAAYEEAAVRRLLGRYPGICEQQVDDLLRNEVFVDLYTVVRQALVIGEPKYSLKNIEHLYRDGKRAGDVASADDSIVAYDNWLHDKDGETVFTSAKLRAIRDYNRDDCESTLRLAEWLRQLQAANALAYIPPSSGTDEKVRELTEPEVFAEELLAAIPTGADRESDPERWRTQELLANLLLFHRREDKPMWWAMYARHEMTEEQLAEDLNCLSGLKRTSKPPIPVKRSFLYEYGFDVDQDTKLDVGSKCILSHDLSSKATIELLDRENGLLSLKLGKDKPAPPLCVSLIPHEYVDASVITESILRTATTWRDNGTLPGAIWDFIRRERPRIATRVDGPIIPEGVELVTGTVDAVSSLQNSTLTIQGPPGTGKTYTAARAILAQLKSGRRVAVAANSHKAINALLNEVAAAAARDKVLFQGIHVWRDPGELDPLPAGIEYRDSVKDIGSLSLINIVGGTAWCFSAPELEGQFTHLFVDEAGQVSIANLVGMARASTNIVLIGDQMQLNQPTQGCHPRECGLSCLEYLLQGHDTILPDFGVFLGVSRRMHPDVCSFISGICYEDRLQAFAATSNRTVVPNGAKIVKIPSGLLFVPTEHDGNSQSSDEEVERVAEIVDELLNLSMYQDNGSVRKTSPEDILVVAPYNMQVRKLQHRLPCLRVGSVDKFQGQEAPIVIYSMCASSGEACSRGVDFLFSRNRTNVAISRAKSLAIIVASPSLIKTKCSSIGHMRLTNIVCRMMFEGVHA